MIAQRIFPAHFIRLVCLFAVKIIYRIKLTGTDRIPKTGGALLLPNHVTFADAFFISAASDRSMRFVMDETFMANKTIRFAMHLFDGVPIRRDQPLEAIRKTIEALREGHLVVLFPEGQLTRTGGLCEIERGFELIARKAKTPIIPLWVDGSWGSIFSFERGRFFRKLPYSIPYGLSIAIGPEITSGKPTCGEAQAALMKASSEAIALRFPKGATPAQLNAHRMTRLEAIPRGSRINILEGELDKPLVSSLDEFARLTKGRLVMHEGFGPLLGEHWVGGDRLRKQITETDRLENGITFHDFGCDALLPLEKENLTHLPCLAAGGDVIAMSLPDPILPNPTSTFQAGHKPESWGKILPGWHLEYGRVFPGNLPLPEGATIDGEAFLVRG
jgi:acyl-[acyl-carrier-protein]-phospholipid O-acyltransferase/long-chain-fatty-acid--[acyl-carrier-protein] ligase